MLWEGEAGGERRRAREGEEGGEGERGERWEETQPTGRRLTPRLRSHGASVTCPHVRASRSDR